jgi:homospermidine synthase
MIDRCHLPTSHTYNRYGERGISVCERWHNFENFYADMGDKPEGMSLERIDNNGDYCPENVIWATAKQQANNRKSNVVLEHNGKKQTMQQWCDELGLKIGTVWARLNVYGYTVEQALTAGRRVRHAY